MGLFEVKAVDLEFYERRLKGFLPDRMIDVHTHVWREADRTARTNQDSRVVSWPSLVAKEDPVEDLVETYRLMFPDKSVTPLIFSLARPGDDLDRLNGYVSACAAMHGFPALVYTSPWWTAEELDAQIVAGGFIGAKAYLDLTPDYLPRAEIRILDFFPRAHLEVLNRRGMIAILHIPRDGRLRDRVNLAQMVEIEERYPNIKLIIAHVGRAYCLPDIGDAFEVLSQTERMYFDISANTNSDVFRQLLAAVGPKRVLFGSDLPILRMRMHRICEHGVYINVVPKGLYGDVSSDAHMREVTASDAERLTFFMYEEIDAFRRAAHALKLTDGDVEDVFYNNAAALIASATPKPQRQQLQMVWPKARLGEAPTWSLPAGYSLRTWREGDAAGYIRVMHLAGFTHWTEESIEQQKRKWLPNGLFFVVEDKTGTIVATAVGNHGPAEFHPFGGELGWVAGDPAHKGRGLGGVVCAAVVKRFLDAGYTEIFLRTDDERLPAIKTYLKLGFRPFLHAPDMEERWRKVCEALGTRLAQVGAERPAQGC